MDRSKILVVDRDPGLMAHMRKRLRAAQMDAWRALTEDQARRRFATDTPDAVVLGEDLGATARHRLTVLAEDLGVPVVATTHGDDIVEHILEALRAPRPEPRATRRALVTPGVGDDLELDGDWGW